MWGGGIPPWGASIETAQMGLRVHPGIPEYKQGPRAFRRVAAFPQIPSAFSASRAPKGHQKPPQARPWRLPRQLQNLSCFFSDFWCPLASKMVQKRSQNRAKIHPESTKITWQFPYHIFLYFSTDLSWIRKLSKPRKSLIFIANSSKIVFPAFWFPCRFRVRFSTNFSSILASKID